MPGSPNNKVIIAGATPQTTMVTGTTNIKAAMRTQEGLEAIQRLIADNTSPPVNVSLAAIDTWVAAIP